ncbi:thaumatin-like protein 1b [Prosopis cineraria]|uniref:thaumatin-like protein 1b n=1 Tax=Prosopis cineraria TaxID=364024 RepID=UPI00240EA3EB|nr:thaumatin-like protein 1b [Prosopis cineraria]
MNTQLVLSLVLAFFFFAGIGAQAATITFTNKCQYTVWPGTLTGDQKPQLSKTGFELKSGASTTVGVPSPWSGRFWARTGCTNNAGKFTCATADCGSGQVACNGAGAVPPATLAELTVAANGGQDFYDVSNVDGFNVPMSIAPRGGKGDCKPSSCPANINAACPAELQVKGSGGKVIACKSACLAFNKPEYCCTGSFAGGPDKCPPTKYSEFFEKQCPGAYSYAYDDKSSTFTCFGGPNYVITFCP